MLLSAFTWLQTYVEKEGVTAADGEKTDKIGDWLHGVPAVLRVERCHQLNRLKLLTKSEHGTPVRCKTNETTRGKPSGSSVCFMIDSVISRAKG